MYTFSEAGHLAHVSPSTVRNWLFGYAGGHSGQVAPLFARRDETGAMVSFLQLIEIVVAGNFRKAEHVGFQTVRQGLMKTRRPNDDHIVERLRSERPGRSLQALDQPLQWTLQGLVLETLEQLDFESELAARWYPVGKSIPIVVDPKITSGLPTIVGRGVTVEVIHQRFKAGQRLEYIAQDFVLEPVLVEEALRYAEKVTA
jgi:uncharacterized protein (DUF433 family)